MDTFPITGQKKALFMASITARIPRPSKVLIRITNELGWISLGILLAACAGPLQPTATPGNPAPMSDTAPSASTTATPTQAPTSPTPVPPTSTRTPTPTRTQTPTPTATPLHPLTIQWLRQQSYPGSDIVIEEQLEPGPNYDRYVVSYRSEGLKIFALMTIPFGTKPESGWPVIIFNHGYIPPEQYRTTERYVAYVDGFARSGYIVFRSDFRGHGESEGIARGAYGAPDYTIDVLNAVAAMRRYPDADPGRIGMWGHSMGGFITLRAMVVDEEIRAGVLWAGMVAPYLDLLTRWAHRAASNNQTPTVEPRRWRAFISDLYGTSPEFWDEISANTFLTDLSGPVQLHHGTADRSVPIEFSETLYEQIQDVDGTVEYYTYEGDDHNLSVYFTQAMLRSIAFFDTYVKGPGS